ncbi:thrombospondin-type laminin G domain and EAR repeat-containing protein isoform X1 [Oryzias melastigma]|uniref:thrombospondin-type laminin G domain and EAR repeat-containing protein isoform X1 n=1 Tax=Oryzias melastigma TaxID=30732 RepID=UPI000CF83443|nr:thrombospondin-type laminin G domain and EAR repeat-containing protein isoform X1 [Oryzias melastigma]XP_036065621.1 thrombospondin-type laminin G domain and EAR repeat-containing protein isoform X1 [Oryzias melastigma]XP_036065622.1 thrombospondin-type laminin G domain and EAR repeat-containing protein isoform X1 [Oryzias melastigma]
MLMRPNKSSLPSAGMWCYPLLLTGVLLTVPVQSQSWRPCTDLLPLDLLSRALASPSQSLTSQLQMVQSRGSRGFRLAGTMATSMSFRASQIFTNCNYFPAEFSLVATLKISKLRQKTNEYIFSVVKEGSNLLLLGLRVSENHLHLVILSPAVGRRSRVTFKDVNLDDNRWHTVVLAVTGPYATLTVDCGLPLEIKQVQSFPSALSTKGSRFFIGGRGQWRGRFTGLLRQLVLLPGSDATPRLCPNSEPSLAELSVPQVLKSTPLQPDSQGPVYPYEAETRVTVGDHPPCSKQEHGQLWFNTQRKSLFICDGLMWRTLLQNKERLDYVEDYQDLYTRSETLDIEVFFIPSEGLFMAAANKDSRLGSGIFRWKNGSFHFYQNISTQEARAWKHFTIDNKTFLVVADLREEEPELSIIYRWNKRRRRFVRHQALETHGAQDWEAFQIHNSSFLVVANHRARDVNHNIHSVIYRWNPDTKLFEVNQTLHTTGAFDWEFFTVGPYHFLVVANTFDGRTTTISSTIYVWLDGRFKSFQNITTVGATDWEAFQIDGRFFLAVANSQKFTDTGQSLYSLNSTVYELNTLTQTFIRFQDILTHSALDWEFFIIGDEKFLVVANSHDGSSYSLNSVIYRWQGYEGFVPVHSLPTFGCRDWEYFSTDEGSFLIYSSAMSPLSKVFRLRTY